MSDDSKVRLIVDPSLLDPVAAQLAARKSGRPPDVAITNLLMTILDHSPYPLRAKQADEREIHIRYHVRSFSNPFVD